MPNISGMEALKMIKQMYQEVNEELLNLEQQEETKQNTTKRLRAVQRPLICYYSQYDSTQMQKFITDEERADYYLEKPIPLQELTSLLRLINVLWLPLQENKVTTLSTWHNCK